MRKLRFAGFIFFLVLAASLCQPAAASERKRAAILIFNGVQVIDYAGPYEVFGQAGFDVYTVAADAETITTAMGMRVSPSYTLDNAPKPDVIIIPGRNAAPAQDDPRVIAWIRRASEEAEYVIEAAGLSSGVDASLSVVSKMSGKGAAQLASLNMEYNWQPNTYARAELADMSLPKILTKNNAWFNHSAGVRLDVLRYEGSRDRWSLIWLAMGDTSPSDLLRQLDAALATEGRWTRQAEGNTMQTRWTFTDAKGKTWNGLSSVSPFEAQKDIHTITLEIWK